MKSCREIDARSKKKSLLVLFEDRKDETYEGIIVWKKNKLLVKYSLPVKMSSYVGIQFRSSFQVNRGGGLPPRNLYKFNGRF